MAETAISSDFAHGGAKRVLIVEDDPVSALLLRRVLEHRGYSVDQADNGRAGLESFARNRQGIVISDWMMPEMDGVTLTREVRRLGGAYVYVVLLSAKGQRADRLEAFEAGVDDFLTKPLDRDELFARLKVAERILITEERLRRQQDELALATDRLSIANQNLLMASRRFEELFTGMPVACFTFDETGVVHEWNRSAEILFSKGAHEALLMPLWRTFDGKDNGFWGPHIIESLFKGEAIENQEWVFDAAQGPRTLVANVFALRNPAGDVMGAISANLDITERVEANNKIQLQALELMQANERLATLAVTDGLTGLWNHRRFREELDRAFSGHARKQWPLSLIFLDVDHFKQFNDAFGHPAGDEVLKEVSRLMQSCSRTHETVARYGGEEFAIILPGASAEDGMAAAERIRGAIESAEWKHRPMTASLGVATLSQSDQRPEDLVQRADLALYAAKHGGRNCARHFDALGSEMENSDHLGLKRTA